MKTLILSSFFLITSILGHSQECNPMSENMFQKKLNTVSMQSTDNAKLNKAYVQYNGQCLTSYQVKRVAQTFSMDAVRYEFCVLATKNVSDPANFYDVYDAFQTLSFVMRLHDHMHGEPLSAQDEPETDPDTETSTTGNTQIIFPDLVYPSYQGELESTGCSYPMDKNAFMNYAVEVKEVSGDMARYNHIKGRMSTHCLSMAQTMKLATMVEDENIRMQMMQDLIMGVYDREHYEHGKKVFEYEENKTKWIAYCGYLFSADDDDAGDSDGENAVMVKPLKGKVCKTSTEDFQSIKKSISQENFPDDKLKKARYFSTRRCFSVQQVKQLMNIFSFDDNKMEVAKMMYKKCHEKDQYYKLQGELTFSSNKNEFMDWLSKQD